MSVATISPNGLARKHGEATNVELIDVRTPAEFAEVHVNFARNVPLDQFDPAAIIKSRDGSNGESIYLICHSGGTQPKGVREVAAGRFYQCRQR